MTIHGQILRTLRLGFLLFLAARVALYVGYYNDQFKVLSWSESLLSFLDGVRFDLSVCLTFIGLPLWLCSLPFSRNIARFTQPIGIWCARAALVIMAFLLAGDVLYFGYVQRHMFDELLQISSDLGFLWTTAFKSYFTSTLTALCLVGSISYVWHRSDRWPMQTGRLPWAKSAGWLLLFVCLVRGSVGLKPLNIPDAYRLGNEAHAQLALNGVFSAWHATRQSNQVKIPSVEPALAAEALQALGYSVDPAQTFSRAIAASINARSDGSPYKNVVIFLLESWFNPYIDALGGNHVRVTPTFDRLAKQGILFSNFFSNGSRSIEAIQSLLTSFPPLPGQPYLGHGLEMILRTGLGSATNSRQMRTYFAQSAPRDSFRLKPIAGALGFSAYYGAEDFPRILNYDQKVIPIFGYDYEMLQFMKKRFDRADSAFAAFLFTGSTHTPFMIPPLYAESAPPQFDPEGEQGFLQTLYYSDASLDAFMKSAETSSWYRDTLFVFTGDHTFPKYQDFDTADRYRVPLLLWSPRMTQGQRIETYGTHVDILPTIAPMLGWNGTLPTAGKDLMSTPVKNSFALITSRSGRLLWIDPRGLIRMQGTNMLEQIATLPSCQEPCTADMQIKAWALQSHVYQTIKTLN